jgi:hypothetical protein
MTSPGSVLGDVTVVILLLDNPEELSGMSKLSFSAMTPARNVLGDVIASISHDDIPETLSTVISFIYG